MWVNREGLPSEVLRRIFKYITIEENIVRGISRSCYDYINIKDTLKNCLLVCKSWNSVAREFFSRDITMVLNGDKLPKLSDDIPFFGHTVTSIKFTPSNIYYVPRKNEIAWKNILSKCPNLVLLHLSEINYGNIKYLKMVLDSDINFKNIQKIIVTNTKLKGLRVEDIYLKVQLRFCASITELIMKKLEKNSVIKEYGGLIPFISQFPNLVSLEVSGVYTQSTDRNVDIRQLFQAAPQLKVLSLYDVPNITATPQSANTETIKTNKNLTSLKIKSKEMNIKAVEYITTDLVGQMANLRLEANCLESDSTHSEQESQKMLNDLESCITGIKNIDISYTYKNEHHRLNHGKVPATLISDDEESGYYDDLDYGSWRDCVDDEFFYDSG